jgi:hypothetical protein
MVYEFIDSSPAMRHHWPAGRDEDPGGQKARLSDARHFQEAGWMPALPRNCERNEIHRQPLNALVGAGKAWRVGDAASQETDLTG